MELSLILPTLSPSLSGAGEVGVSTVAKFPGSQELSPAPRFPPAN